VGILRAALVVGDAALIYAVWQLGRARDRRWDLRGWVALGALLVAWPALLMFVTWTVIAAVVLITGQPLRLFGD
jgi:hypothetical protein